MMNQANMLLKNRLVVYTVRPIYQTTLITPRFHYSAKTSNGNQYLQNEESPSGERPPTFMDKAKKLFHFYKDGLIQINTNRKEAKEIKNKLSIENRQMLRNEFLLVHKSREDIKKLIPFMFLLIILPESIPFLVVFAPQFVPSTCITPEQKLKKRTKNQEQRDKITEGALKATRDNDQLLTLKHFQNVDSITKAFSTHRNSLNMQDLRKGPLQGYLRFMGLSTFGTMSMLHNRMAKHFEFLKKDDQYLRNEDLNKLTHEELIEACEARGIRTLEQSDEQMINSLKLWLEIMNLDSEMPILFPILVSIFRNYIRVKE